MLDTLFFNLKHQLYPEKNMVCIIQDI